jgi:hypothetical protein
MKTTELKLAEQIANATDDHYFNSSIIAHYLADQPYHTIDRIVELIVKTIRYQAQPYLPNPTGTQSVTCSQGGNL